MKTFESMDKRRMYQDLSWAWPIVSPPEDYVVETEEFVALINEHARIPVREVLNLGCGGGHNDFTLKKHFDVTGVDISEDMLELARALNPDNHYFHGDMRAVRLGQSFDAVTVFDSILYMRTPESLRAAFMTAYSHLRPGGVFLTYIEESKDRFRQNKTISSTHRKNDIEIALVENYYDPDPDDTSYEANFIFFVRRSGQLAIETDCHILGLFEHELWIEQLEQIGLEVHQHISETPDATGEKIPILVCVKSV